MNRPRYEFPTLQQVRELPLQLRYTIPPEWEDRNGHVNVQFYLGLFELGGWKVLEEIGVDEEWFRRRAYSFFDLEHHLHYRAEIGIGSEVTCYNRIVGRSERCFHGFYLIVNETRQRLAGTLEYISAGIDMNARRMADMPAELAAGIDCLLEKHRRLSWQAPLCGVMAP